MTVRNADGIKALDSATFDVYGGEILGIAGISGCGQKELLEAIAGLHLFQLLRLRLQDRQIRNRSR